MVTITGRASSRLTAKSSSMISISFCSPGRRSVVTSTHGIVITRGRSPLSASRRPSIPTARIGDRRAHARRSLPAETSASPLCRSCRRARCRPGQGRQQARELEDKADAAVAEGRQLVIRQAPDVDAVDHDRAVRRAAEASDHGHQRGLARARAADDSGIAAGFDVEVDAAHGQNLAASVT